MIKYNKNIVVSASVLTALTIVMGAFGAHSLKGLVTPERLIIFETGIRYQMYHALALFVLGVAPIIPEHTKRLVFWFFLSGILFFSGSLYLLALKEQVSFDVSFLGPITPIGGLLFVVGWLYLGFGAWKQK